MLKSWDGATGAIEIPAHVTEIAANCFYEPADEDPDNWDSTSEEKCNTNITSIKLNNVKKVGKKRLQKVVLTSKQSMRQTLKSLKMVHSKDAKS